MFAALLVAALPPAGAMAFAAVRGAHDAQRVIESAPAPLAHMCRVSVGYSFSPLGHVAFLILGLAAAVSLCYASLSVASLHRRTRRRLRVEPRGDDRVPSRVRRIAARAQIRRVTLIETEQPKAFTFGYLRPSVALSRGLVARLEDEELEAVLRHEGEHVRRRDPLRILVVTGITRALFLAPVIKRLGEAFFVAKEVDADCAVVSAMGSRRPLVSALLSARAQGTNDAAPSFADTLLARIAWLEGDHPLPHQPQRPASWLLTLASVGVIAVGVFIIVTRAVDAHVLHACMSA
jgi:Zn-dependent protease with chaperone function